MKKYLLIFCLTVAVISWILSVPAMLSAAAVTVPAVRIVGGEIANTVSCEGTITAANSQSICYGYPLKINKCYAQVGNYVKKGQKLLDIDRMSTVYSIIAKAENLGQAVQNSGNNNSGSDADSDSGVSPNGTDYSGMIKKAEQSAGISGLDYASIFGALQKYSSQPQSAGNSSSASPVISSSIDDIPQSVYAPTAGMVTSISVSDGEFSTGSEPLLEISDMGSLEVMAEIQENDLSRIKTGDSASITGPGFSQTYTGKIKQIYPKVQSSDGTSGNVVNVAVAIDHPDSGLIPGMTSQVNVVSNVIKRGIVAPYQAIREDSNGREFVYTYNKGRSERHYIKTGQEFDNGEEILNGVSSGDDIIVNPPDDMKNGQHIKITGGGLDNND